MKHPMDLSDKRRTDEQGIALILVVVFVILLAVVSYQLVVQARMSRLTGENDALLARMRNHMEYTINEVEGSLKEDMQADDGGDEGGASPLGGLGGAGSAGGGEGANPLGGGGEGEDVAANTDSSRDSWFQPTAYSDDDLTTYVWVEDENRKFNILSLISPEEDYAKESKERFVRLIDELRDGTEFDLSSADGQQLAQIIIDWMEGVGRTEDVPRPQLKSDREDRQELTIMLHLDDLLMLRDVDEDLFYDKVLDAELIPGLESVLTIYTSLLVDPGDPEKLAQQDNAAGAGQDSGSSGQSSEGSGGPVGSESSEQPIGIGVRINLNTAPYAVLRSLFPRHQIPDAVIDAIIAYRNEEAEEEEDAAGEQGGEGAGGAVDAEDYSGDIRGPEEVEKKIFEAVEDLEEIPEFKNIADPEIKQQFYALTTVQSDVFTIHMASMFKRKKNAYVLRRARSVVVRLDHDEEGVLYPLIRLEESAGRRIMPVDVVVDVNDYANRRYELDEFSREEEAWNPFLIDFYRPDWQRGEDRE